MLFPSYTFFILVKVTFYAARWKFMHENQKKNIDFFWWINLFWGNAGLVEANDDDYYIVIMRHPYLPNTLLNTFFRFQNHVVNETVVRKWSFETYTYCSSHRKSVVMNFVSYLFVHFTCKYYEYNAFLSVVCSWYLHFKSRYL